MADPLAVIGGIASVAQIFGCIVQTTETIAKFCHEVQDAPTELHRIKDKLIILKIVLENFQHHLQEFDDDVVVPPDLRELLMRAVTAVKGDAEALQYALNEFDSVSVRKRLRWAFVNRHVAEKLLARLQGSENTLNCVGQLLNM